MPERTDKLLTDGLAEGYVGIKKPEKVQRSGFSGKANDYTTPEGGHYRDEWFADDNGGGQELAKEGSEQSTRVYAGGVISTEELQKLGLTTKDVISRLIISVGELKEKTRLSKPCSLTLPDGWKYDYKILKQSEEVPLTIGYESIECNGREVFAHGHMLSPIK
jgi:hypothetical protein